MEFTNPTFTKQLTLKTGKDRGKLCELPTVLATAIDAAHIGIDVFEIVATENNEVYIHLTRTCDSVERARLIRELEQRETPAQAKVRELEATIAEAQAQIQQLKREV